MDSPSREDDAMQQPFVGPQSRKLDSILAKFNIHRSQVYITYATRCRANLRTVEGVRPAHFDEIQACNEYLVKELETIKPHIIVPMGTEAVSAVFNLKKPKVGELRGVEAWSDRFNCKILPTYSTGAVIRNPNLEEVMTQDIRRAIESSVYPQLTAVEKGNYIVIDSMESLDAFFERVMEQEEVSIDLETTGFDWQNDKIICCSFSWKANTGVLLPITKWVGVPHEKIVIKEKKVKKKGIVTVKQIEEIEKTIEDTYHPWWGDKQDYVLSKFRAIMESNIKFIAQNGKFDWKFLLQMGWNVKPLAYDTLLMHYLLRETSKGEHNLEDMSLQYLGKGQHKKELDDWFNANGMKDDDNKNYARVPPELLFSYGAADADVTLQLKNIFLPRIEEEGMWDLLHHLVMPLNYTLTTMEFDGFKMDPRAVEYARTELELQLIAKEKEIKDILIKEGILEPVDIDSPKQLSKLLFETLGLEPVKQTKTGFSTDEEVMLILKDKHPIPMLIVEFRGLAKLLRTYVIGIQERIDKNNRLHTKFLQEGTESGRLSSRDPNFQNFPRDSKLIKNMFIVDKGNVLIEADEGQNEFRWWGIYSNDPQLVKDLNDGVDIHKLVAALANNIPIEQVTKKQRQAAKSIVFGLMFNMGSEKLAKEHGVTIAYAEEVKAIFFNRYPVAKQWKYDIVNYAKKHFFVQNRFGRRRHLLAIKNPDKKIAYADEQGAVNCVDENTEILTTEGWKNYKEIQEGELVATKNPQTGALEWQPIKRMNISNYNGPMFSFESNTFSALTTPNHRWLIDHEVSSHRDGKYFKNRQNNIFKDSQSLSKYGEDKIHLTVDSYAGNLISPFTNDEVEFIGWLMTDGNYATPYFDKKRNKMHKRSGLNLYQSLRANLQKCEQIDSLLKRLGIKAGIYIYPRTQEKVWRINDKKLISKIREWLPTRYLTPQFLLMLSNEQLHILYNTMLLGDGTWDKNFKRHRRFSTKTKQQIDIFSMLCVLIGKAHTISERDMSKYKPKSLKLLNIPKMGIINQISLKQRDRVQSQYGRKILENWNGIVWCPTVENSTWIARRNGIVYITGNSPIQGAASDYVSNAANRIFDKLKENGLHGKLRNLVHDAIYVEVPRTEIKQTLEIMNEAMTRKILGIQVPLIAEFKIGRRWGRMHNLKVDNIIRKEVAA